MVYWKIFFNDGITGLGWARFNEYMECDGLFDDAGQPIIKSVGYYPVEKDGCIVTSEIEPWR